MSITKIASNIMVYKMIKLLSSPYEKWSYFKDGIIDMDGNYVDGEKSTAFLRFLINIKKLIQFHPLGKLRLSSLPMALSLLKENEDEMINIDFDFLESELIRNNFMIKD